VEWKGKMPSLELKGERELKVRSLFLSKNLWFCLRFYKRDE
jgi:hypothetical protein